MEQGQLFRRLVCDACGAEGWVPGTKAQAPPIHHIPEGWRRCYTSRYQYLTVCHLHAEEADHWAKVQQERQAAYGEVARSFYPAAKAAYEAALAPLREWEAMNPRPRLPWEKE